MKEEAEPPDLKEFITDTYSTLECMSEIINNPMNQAPWNRINELDNICETLSNLRMRVTNYFKGCFFMKLSLS